MLRALGLHGVFPSKTATASPPRNTAVVAHPVVTDLTVRIFSPTVSPSTCELNRRITWHRIEKDLYQYKSQQSAWLYVALANEEELVVAQDLVVVDISVGERPPNPSSGHLWESHHGGIWVLKSEFSGRIDQAVTEVDVLFGTDAVDPRPQWALMESSLRLNAQPEVPVARLTVLHGRVKPRPDPAALRVRDGKFKIVQISDTHMVTGVGICKDAIDADGKNLPESEADPRTVKFMKEILDVEKPDLVVLTGDQLHHGNSDSHTALLKVVAPMIESSTPFAAVFGNHDSEGIHALSRTAQMSILQNLPFSLSESGPEQVDGIGNFYLQVLAPAPSQLPLSTLYFLDSHGQIPRMIHNPDYDPIKQSQIDWFTNTSQTQRNNNPFHLSVAFQHIPLPEFGDSDLRIVNGHRREPTEGPRFNSHFYDALAREGIVALCCGHDHVNSFCGLLPQQAQQDSDNTPQLRPQLRPWLCHGGCSGFGAYCSYDGKRFHRQMRVLELDTSTGSLNTWMRVEYNIGRVDERVLVESGLVVDPPGKENKGRSCVVS